MASSTVTDIPALEVTRPAMPDQWELLLMACSRAKDDNKTRMPAIRRYDGPTFRTLRATLVHLPGTRYGAERYLAAPPWLQIYIISGKFGLVWYNQYVPWYDQKMTLEIASRLSMSVLPQLVDLKNSDGCPRHLMYVGPGSPYGQLIHNIDKLFPGAEIVMNVDRIGKQCQALKRWLLARGKEHQ